MSRHIFTDDELLDPLTIPKQQLRYAIQDRAVLTCWDDETHSIYYYRESSQYMLIREIKNIKEKLKSGEWSGGLPRGSQGSPQLDRIIFEGVILYPILVKTGLECPVLQLFQGWGGVDNPNEWTPYFLQNKVDHKKVIEYLHPVVDGGVSEDNGGEGVSEDNGCEGVSGDNGGDGVSEDNRGEGVDVVWLWSDGFMVG